MEDNKDLVLNGTENAEHTAENVEQVDTPKTYTQEELDQIVSRRLARNTAKIRKEYDKKYGELETVLSAGTGEKDVEGMTNKFREFYQKKGITIPNKPAYTDKDIEVLAKAEAEDVISGGYEEVVEEVDRLANLGNRMTAREQAVFRQLAEYRQNAERGQELSKIGVTEDVYSSKEFKEFSSKFSPNTSVKEIYEIYNKMQPKKEVRPMGSMTNNVSADSTVKEFYTRDEALKFTTKDFDKNPALYKAVVNSMSKW